MAYLWEIGRGDERSRWRDHEEVYFVVNLLKHLCFATMKYQRETMTKKEMETKGLICSYHENSLLSKCSIGIVVPFAPMVSKYKEVIEERLLHKFNLNNVKIGLPQDFHGYELDIVILSSFRNSVDEGLGCFTRVQDSTLDLQLLRMVLSRSNKFFWIVGSGDTLESTGDRTLNGLTRFFKASSSTYRRFEDQNDWKKQRFSFAHTNSAIRNTQGGSEGQLDLDGQMPHHNSSARFY